VAVYARILRAPGVAWILFATLIGRLPIGISGLAILLYVREVTGSFAAAGASAGALALGSAIGAPLQGRLVDRRGLRALLPLAFVHAGGLMAVWGSGAAGGGPGALVAASFLAGAAIPPLTSVLRSRWPYLLEHDLELVPSAYALDTVMVEVVFVLGPLLTTIVVATVGPEYALIVSAASVLSGTALLLACLRDRPGPAPTAGSGSARGLGALAAPGLRVIVLASVPVGFALGSIEVVLPAFSEAEGSRELAGVLLAVWSLASGVGGLLWGVRGTRLPLLGAHVRLTLLLPLAIAPLALATSPPVMLVLVILSGLPVAPLIASRTQLVERVAPPGTATEAFTWPLTALVGGVSLGAAVSGAVIEAGSWSAAVVVAAVVGLAGAVIVTRGRATLAPPLATPG
jgi:MFS family permease